MSPVSAPFRIGILLVKKVCIDATLPTLATQVARVEESCWAAAEIPFPENQGLQCACM
jgi:hypothetical protein